MTADAGGGGRAGAVFCVRRTLRVLAHPPPVIRPSSAVIRMPHELHDHYFRLAKREGYASRAAYKLIEIDERRKILRPGFAVLDLGAAPGSWMQVAAGRVGPRGFVVGVDLAALGVRLDASPARAIQGDLFEIEPAALLDALPAGRRIFDVILSDLAPRTGGDRSIDHHASVRLVRRVLELCPGVLSAKGTLVYKVFEGESYSELLARTRTCFERVKAFRPRASRRESREMYVIAEGFDAIQSARLAASEERGSENLLAPRRPAFGWGARGATSGE